jgi:natural product precursor
MGYSIAFNPLHRKARGVFQIIFFMSSQFKIQLGKKLDLKKETISRLDDKQLRAVAGGSVHCSKGSSCSCSLGSCKSIINEGAGTIIINNHAGRSSTQNP